MANNQEYIWDVEEQKIKKEEQEKLAKRKKEKKRREEKRIIKEKKRKKKRNTKITIIFITVLSFLLIIFFPYIKIQEINVQNNVYINAEEIKAIVKKYQKNNNISLYNYFSMSRKLKKNEFIEGAKVSYKFDNNILNISIDELIPVYHDINSSYYIDNSEKLSTHDKDIATPLINDPKLTEDDLNNISLQLSKLKKEIFLQIKEIKLADENTDVLIVEMNDNNTVYVLKGEFYEKMQYYDQIKEILDSLGKEPGYLHLDIGDYYEPKN